MKLVRRTLVAAAIVMPFMAPGAAQAQATRTWVSGVGDDANPCSRTAPCKTFAGAISKTAAGGEINCLDPGGFGSVTITKSITIDCRGTFGSILAAQTNGVTVNGNNVVVVLRNLAINAPGNGNYGIRLINGARLEISGVTISGMGAANGAGISIAGGNSSVFIRNIEVSGSRIGLVVASTGTAQVMVVGSAFVGNAGAGIAAQTAGARVHVADTTISGNGVALLKADGGTIHSYGNNQLVGNTGDSAFTGAVRPQ